MTDLQIMYNKARLELNKRHHAAVRHVSRQTGIDQASVQRALIRADREDQRSARRSKKVAAAA